MTVLLLWLMSLADNPACVTADAAWDNYGADYGDYCPTLEAPSEDEE